MANFKIISIKVLKPQEEFLKWNYGQLIEAFGDPVPEDIALRVSRYKNIHKILEPGTEYRFQEIDGALPEDFFQVKKDYEENERVIDLSVCAIVGQNGSGKSTLLELMIRLLNNAAFALKNAYVSHPSMELQFVEDVYAEMTFQMPDGVVYVLRQEGTVITCESGGVPYWSYDCRNGELLPQADATRKLQDFFFTIVLNYSAYSFNLYNFRPEWRGQMPNDGLEYTDEDRCWLGAIFHKNDAYQTPIVLNPFRSFGEIDFNNEADLTRDRLVLLSIQNVDMMSVLMEGVKTHSIVFDTKMSLLEQPKIPYSSPLLVDTFIQLRNISHRYDVNDAVYNRCQRLCDIVIDEWSKVLDVDLKEEVADTMLRQDIRRAVNYLVYKTIKSTRNYALYSNYRQCFVLPREVPDDVLEESFTLAKEKIPQLVKELWEDPTHVTLKIHKTLAFLKFKHYQLGMGNEQGYGRHEVSAGRYNQIIEGLYNQLGGDGQNTWKREFLLPAPCFDARLILSEKRLEAGGEKVVLTELNSRSSGEMQLLYSLSTVLYHLKNIDSNIIGGRNAVNYPCVNLVFDEIELYFHPNFQKDLLYDLIYAIRKMRYGGIRAVNIIIATHSPYILSDFPKSNVLCMEKGKVYQDALEGMGNTFGANVYDILNSRFFMKEFVGKFAVRKLEEIIETVKEGGEITLEEYRQRKVLVDVIGDEFIREKLTEELLDKLNRHDRRMMAREEIDRIERRKQYLEDLINAPAEERRVEE
ncbi:MAG: AAA family ATPase [Bacteroidales bacterium]|nr:AAA family ATPase [Bacteroidales bacterium]